MAMKTTLYLIAALSLYGAHTAAMIPAPPTPQSKEMGTEERQIVKTDFSQQDIPSCQVRTEDNMLFTIAQTLTDRLQLLCDIKAVSLASSIVPVKVTALQLEKVLLFAQGEDLPPKLTIEELGAILTTIDYFDARISKQALYKALAQQSSWDTSSLEAFFCDSQISHWDKMALIPFLACKLRWNMTGIARWYNNQEIEKCYTLALIERLVEETPGQLIQFIDYFALHERQCIDRGLNPMESCIFFSEPNETEKQSHAELKALLKTDDYACICERLLFKYKSPTKAESKASLDALLAILDEGGEE